MMNKQLQKKYVQLQMLKQQFNAYIEEKNLIDEKVNEVKITIEALQKVSDIKKGTEIWSSVGSGSYVMSDIKNTDTVLVNIGAGVIIKKKMTEAISIMQARLDEIEGISKEIMSSLEELAENISTLEPEVQKLYEQQEGKGE